MTGTPSDMQLDALREVANIGCGHAASALSRLVGGRTVKIDVPRVLTASIEDIAELVGGDGAVVAVTLEIEGEVRGRMGVMWPLAHARSLAELLTGDVLEGDVVDDAAARSALAEVGNIVGSACLSAIGTLSRLRLLPSIPSLSASTARAVAEAIISDAASGERAVVLEARFLTAHGPSLDGQLLLVPDRASLPRLFAALGI